MSKKTNGKGAPAKIRWIPDEEAPSCMSCVKEFNLSRRRHHCRLCGHVVCGPCSKNRIKLSSGPIRVCDECFVSFDPSGSGNRRDFRPVGNARTLNSDGYSRAPPSKSIQQTPAQALLGADGPASPRSPSSTKPANGKNTAAPEPQYHTYQTEEDATATTQVNDNTHRQLYESPLLAENPSKCCCVVQ